MNKVIQNALAKWQSLNQREQIMVSIAAIVVGIFLVYQIYYLPMHKKITQLQTQLVQQQTTLAFMRSAVPNIIANKKNPGANRKKTSALLPYLESSLKKNRLDEYSANVRQARDGQINVTLKAIPAQRVFNWLSQIDQNTQSTISRLRIQRSQQDGLVNVSFSLK